MKDYEMTTTERFTEWTKGTALLNRTAAAILFAALIVAAPLPSYGTGLEGGPTDSAAAYRMVTANPAETFILDVRTRAEYEFVGHPDVPGGAANIPLMFYPSSYGKRWEKNKDFVADVSERYKEDR